MRKTKEVTSLDGSQFSFNLLRIGAAILPIKVEVPIQSQWCCSCRHLLSLRRAIFQAMFTDALCLVVVVVVYLAVRLS